MATNINITVGDDDLVARARQEMAAHRSGSNIAQSRTKAGEKGKTERARRLAIQGKDGQGRIIPTAPFQPPRRPDEITANPEVEKVNLSLSWLIEGSENYHFGVSWDGYTNTPKTNYRSKYVMTNQSGRWGAFGSGHQVRFSGAEYTQDFNRKRYVQIGCGNGTKWLTCELGNTGMSYEALSSAGSFSELARFTETFAGSVSELVISRGDDVVHNLTENTAYDVLILPAGRNNHIIVVYGISTYSYVLTSGLYYHYEWVTKAGIYPDGPPWYLLEDYYPSGFWQFSGTQGSGGQNVFNFVPLQYRVEFWGSENSSFAGWANPGYDGGYLTAAQFGSTQKGLLNIESVYGRQTHCKCYVANHTNIRELTPPQALLDWIYGATNEATQAQTVTETVELRKANSNETAVSYTHTKYPGGYVSFPQGGTGIEPGVQSLGVSPEIFANMNQVAQFTDPVNIRTFDSKERYVLEDLQSNGVFKDVNAGSVCGDNPNNTSWALTDLYKPAARFKYALWGRANEEPEYEYADPACWEDPNVNPYPAIRRLRKSFALAEVPEEKTGVPSQGSGRYLSEQLNVTTDWGMPQYCRARCQDLGFTAVDLQP